MVFWLQYICLLKLIKDLVNSLLCMCNGVQIVDGRVDKCGNQDGNIRIDGGNVRSIGQEASLFPAVLNGCCVNLVPGSISKSHCLKLVDLVNIQRGDSLVIAVNCS